MKFMNLTKWLGGGNVYQEEAGGNGDGGGDGGGSGASSAAPPAAGAQSAPTIDYDALASAIAKNQAAAKAKEKPSGYDEHLAEDKKNQDAKAAQKKIESAIKFNSTFADTLSANKEMFPERTANLLTREFGGEEEKADAWKRHAAKDFFTMEGNVDLLSPSERLLVENKLTAEHADVTMLGDDAWAMVERALHMKSVKDDAGKRDGAYGGKKDENVPENVKKFVDRVYPNDVVSLPNIG